MLLELVIPERQPAIHPLRCMLESLANLLVRSERSHCQIVDVGGDVCLWAARDDPVECPERDDANDTCRHGAPGDDPFPRHDRGGNAPSTLETAARGWQRSRRS